MKLLLLCGISGSSKTTWAAKFLTENPEYICINRDTLRLALVKNMEGYYRRPDLNRLEGVVNQMVECILTAANQKGYNVVVDNTNLSQKYINSFINYPGVESWQYRLFDIDVEIAKQRIVQRDNLENLDYIDKQHQQFLAIKSYLLTNYEYNQYNG